MATNNNGNRINDLIMAEKWAEARSLIEKALQREPENHWLLTHLGETFYEERKYKEALAVLLRSRDILPDCPLTLWHLAGTCDALGYQPGAIELYTWLLRSNKTPQDDPCWESVDWTDALKTDCVFRMGLCFKHLERDELAEYCFRKYIHISKLGMKGSYSIEEAKNHLSKSSLSKRKTVEDELRETADRVSQTLEEAAIPVAPPKLDKKSLKQLQEA